jgi:hypothetical protein
MTRLPVVLSVAIAACAPMNVSSYIHPAADFSQYRTYDWGPRDALPTGDPRLDNNPFFDSQVRSSVQRELAARGYQRVGSNPDLVVHYHASVQQKVDVYRVDTEAGYRTETDAVQYEEGTLVLDVADAKTKQIIWRGWGQGDIEGVINDQARMEQRVRDVTRKILERFPARR